MTEMSQADIENANLLRTFIGTNVSSILASNVRHIANSKWFDCLSIRVRHIPALGFLQMHYDFNQIEEKLIFNHRLIVSQISIDNIDNSIGESVYDFKLTFEEDFRINKIYLLGRQLSNQEERNDDLFRTINAVHYFADNQELLIATDWSTSRLIITTDKEEIVKFKSEYLITNNGDLQFELLEIDTEKNSH
jgi:hypothetical protein